MGDLTKNFSKKELSCPCCQKCEMNEAFLEKLQELREMLGRPLKITSGFRCESHNKTLEHASQKSFHLLGIAADIHVLGGKERLELVEAALMIGFSGIGVAKNFIHVDTREEPTLFVY